jgi:hypothetical protein
VTPGNGLSAWLPHKKLGRERFASAFRHPFLVCLDWAEAIHDGHDNVDESRSFKTDIITPEALSAVKAQSLAHAWIAAVIKTGRNPYQLIHVGRAANCDIVIPHHSVSKLHAYLSVAPDGNAELTDAGSRNGTYCKGARLNKGQAVSLAPRDEVVVGNIPLIYMDARRFFDLL